MAKNMIARQADSRQQDKQKDLRITNWALLSFLVATTFIVFLRYLRFPDIAPLGVALMWAAACLIAGAFIGFLFCIPRVVDSTGRQANANAGAASNDSAESRGTDEPADSLRVNSNLVEISDWLTKIIVGLGLVNLKDIPVHVENTARVLAGGLAGSASCKLDMACSHYAFALGLIVAFSVLGFLMGYLYTRLFLMGAFRRADSQSAARRLKQIVEGTAMKADPDRAAKVSDDEIQASMELESVPEARDANAVASVMKNLASEYEQLRDKLPPGQERTRRMIQVLLQMRNLSQAAWDQLPAFANSVSAGERLAAIAMLQVSPDITRVGWLIERLTTEKPFLSYASAEALRRAASVFTEDPEKSVLTGKLSAFANSDAGRALLNAGFDTSELLGELLLSLGIQAPQKPG